MWQFLKQKIGLSSINQTKRMAYNIVLFMSIIFVYSVLRVNKDTMVYNASQELSGTLKSFLVLPLSLVSGLMLEWAYKRASSKTVFFSALGGFLTYLFLYVYVFGPYSKNFLIVEKSFGALCYLLDAITSTLSFGNIYLGSILDKLLGCVMRNFSISMYYVIAEIFGNIFIGVMFWGLVNNTTSILDSKKTFTIYSGTSGVSTILAGIANLQEVWPKISKSASQRPVLAAATTKMLNSSEEWDNNLKSGFLKIFAAFCVMGITYYLSRSNAEEDPNISFESEKAYTSKKKTGVADGIKYLFRNKYIRGITLLIFCHSSIMFCIEYLFKGAANEVLGGDKIMFKAVQAVTLIVQGVIGLITTVAVVLATDKKGGQANWLRSALITPTVIGVTSALFLISTYGLIPLPVYKWLGFNWIFNNGIYEIPITAPIRANLPVGFSVGVVLFGAIQGFVSKLAKYIFFDVTKEEAFLVTTYEEKTVGKNAMESVGSRFGKGATGLGVTSFMVPTIRYFTGSSSSIVSLPYLSALCAVLLGIYFREVFNVSSMHRKRLKLYLANDAVVPDNVEELQELEDDELDAKIVQLFGQIPENADTSAHSDLIAEQEDLNSFIAEDDMDLTDDSYEEEPLEEEPLEENEDHHSFSDEDEPAYEEEESSCEETSS